MASLLPTPIIQSIELIDRLDEGIPGPEHFRIKSTETTLAAMESECQEGGIVIQALVFSADPYLRGSIKTGGTMQGNQMHGFIAGKVLVSKNPKWVVGKLLGGRLDFTTFQVLSPEQAAGIWPLNIPEENISYGVGILGMPGSTAYGGLIDVLAAKQGETIFISGAAGAVGGYVGMLAKSLFNCTVIGSCGGPEKVALVKEKFGFDFAIDYKSETASTKEGMVAALKEIAPDGIDMYFDNVGGYHLEAALEVLRTKGRVAICGQIAEYNNKIPNPVPWYPMKMIYSQQRIEGFNCGEWLTGIKGHFHSDMPKWIEEGKLPCIEETVFEGIESWPLAFQSLFVGGNTGKVVVRL
jgi:NADPH-dependent curcumin reductase CurA